jgi:hypothetical protein
MPHGDESYANSIYDDMGHFAEQQRQSELEKLRAENAALRAQVERTTWLPITTAPKDGSFVHLWFPNNGSALSDLCLTCRWAPDGWWIAQAGGRGFRMDGPSHWKAIVPPAFTSDDGV